MLLSYVIVKKLGVSRLCKYIPGSNIAFLKITSILSSEEKQYVASRITW